MYSKSQFSTIRTKRRRPGAAVVLIGAALLAALVLLFSPRVTAAAPQRASLQVPALVPVSLTFSQPMDTVSVESRLQIEPWTEGEFVWSGSTIQFQPFEPWPAGTEVTVTLRPGSRSRGFLPLLRRYSFSFTIGSPRVAYLWPDGSPADIYAVTLDSGQVTRITETDHGVLDFSISSTRSSLVYTEMRADGGTDLVLLNLASGEVDTLYSCENTFRCSRGILSIDGSMVAFERTAAVRQEEQDTREVWVYDLETQQAARISPPGHEASTSSWSVSGELAYHDQTLEAAVVVDPRMGMDADPLHLIPATVDTGIEWLPDGSGLLMPQVFFDEGQYEIVGVEDVPLFHSHIMFYDLDSDVVIDLSGDRDGLVEDSNPEYDPSGQWIAYTRKYLEPERWTLGRQIWVMAADASEKRTVVNEPDFQHASLVWSPDSTKLVYTRFNQSDLIEDVEIWMVDLDTGAAEQLVEGGYAPQWIP